MPSPALLTTAVIDSPVGPLFLEAGERGLRRVAFLDGPRAERLSEPPASAAPGNAGTGYIDEVARQLREYFEGSRRVFDLSLDLEGSPFRRRVWQAIAAIPFGRTTSYSEIALAAGAPNAYRAAGSACGANPVAVVVPCHRVLGADRSLHGYGGGLEKKLWLLRHEDALGAVRGYERVLAGQPALTLQG